MRLTQLHEQFLDSARRPMSFGRLPVMPKDAEVPLIPVNKWTKSDGSLKKSYTFRLGSQRNDFLRQLLDHEEEVGHHTRLYVEEGKVTVTLQTADIEQVTELDKEFSKWLDELFREVVYSTQHE